MAFITFGFYLFLAVLVAVYYLLPLRLRWYTLLAGSLGFYWYVNQYSAARFGMMLGTALLCWLAGLGLEYLQKGRRALLAVSVAAAAAPLLLIKELPFFAARAADPSAFDRLVIPMGIAFYTMQLIAYLVDIYRGTTKFEADPLRFLLFVSFFPQIIQGPIPRHKQLAPQLYAGHCFDERSFTKGFLLILWGFFLKLCIADKAGIFVDTVFDTFPTYTGTYVLLAGILYSFQLYADFLACTSFAQGIDGLFSIEIADNFLHPYFSTSIKDFWRRWHISLSTWLRDYIYIPLGGNRRGRLRKYLNLLITCAVSGVWHGAGYKFIFWGLLHGVYQIVGECTLPLRRMLSQKAQLDRHPNCKALGQRLITFFFVMLAWIIFRAEHLRTGLAMIRSIFTVHNPWILTNDAVFALGLNWKEFAVLAVSLCILYAVSRLQEKGVALRDRILSWSLPLRWCVYIGAILFVLIFGTYGFGYDAQAFIYGGF